MEEKENVVIQPVRDVVFAEIVKAGETRTNSGLVLINAVQTKACKLARVLAVGDGDVFGEPGKQINIHVKVDDIIIINEYDGQSISFRGHDYILVPYTGIFGVWSNWRDYDQV